MDNKTKVAEFLAECYEWDQGGKFNLSDTTIISVRMDENSVTVEVGESGAKVFEHTYKRATYWYKAARKEVLNTLEEVGVL